jgi:hypothetical protein
VHSICAAAYHPPSASRLVRGRGIEGTQGERGGQAGFLGRWWVWTARLPLRWVYPEPLIRRITIDEQQARPYRGRSGRFRQLVVTIDRSEVGSLEFQSDRTGVGVPAGWDQHRGRRRMDRTHRRRARRVHRRHRLGYRGQHAVTPIRSCPRVVAALRCRDATLLVLQPRAGRVARSEEVVG